MSTPTVVVATSNKDKIALFEGWFAARSMLVIAVDPGSAEDEAEVGYETAALAKVSSKYLDAYGAYVTFAHDSGIEYDDLQGRPGPLTKQWVRGRCWESEQPSTGSGATVVHAIAVRAHDRTKIIMAYDRRIVTSRLVPETSLPLTATLAGPRSAFNTALGKALSWASN